MPVTLTPPCSNVETWSPQDLTPLPGGTLRADRCPHRQEGRALSLVQARARRVPTVCPCSSRCPGPLAAHGLPPGPRRGSPVRDPAPLSCAPAPAWPWRGGGRGERCHQQQRLKPKPPDPVPCAGGPAHSHKSQTFKVTEVIKKYCFRDIDAPMPSGCKLLWGHMSPPRNPVWGISHLRTAPCSGQKGPSLTELPKHVFASRVGDSLVSLCPVPLPLQGYTSKRTSEFSREHPPATSSSEGKTTDLNKSA